MPGAEANRQGTQRRGTAQRTLYNATGMSVCVGMRASGMVPGLQTQGTPRLKNADMVVICREDAARENNAAR